MGGCFRKHFPVMLLGGLVWLAACSDEASVTKPAAAEIPDAGNAAEILDAENELVLSSSECQLQEGGVSSSFWAPTSSESHSLEISSSESVSVVPSSSAMALPFPYNGVPYVRIFVEDTMALTITDSSAKSLYTDCTVEVGGNGEYADIPLRGAQIKLRGNSTRLWYDKKPYRIKFQEKTEVLGLAANKDWVLLANFRDPTNLMNALAFDMAREMGSFEFVNGSRFVEVEINGDYKGLYQLTEQVEQAESRVNVAPSGVLLSLDKDDGPELSPTATDNFWSATYKLPVAVKYPKTLADGDLERIREDFKRLEDAIALADYDSVDALLDIRSLIDFLILQEVTRNVELEAPRSMYLHRPLSGSKYVFGPVWDFDGGFGYSWNEETKGYFSSDTWILGTVNPGESPYNCTADKRNDWGMCSTQGGFGGLGRQNSWDGSAASGFFTNLFSDERFLKDYKARWQELSPKLLALVPERLEAYLEECSLAMEKDGARWPWPDREHNLGKDSRAAVQDLENWLLKRISEYSAVVNGY